jgi:hypothetical protein
VGQKPAGPLETMRRSSVMRKDEAGTKTAPTAIAEGDRRAAKTTGTGLDRALAPLARGPRPSKAEGPGAIEDADDWRWVRT